MPYQYGQSRQGKMKTKIQLSKFKQEIGISVGDIMTREVIKVTPETTVKECIEKMFSFKTGSFVVSNKNKVLGIITKRDLLSSIIKSEDPGEVKAREIMTKSVKTIRPDVDMYKALILMKKLKIKKMPVIENNKVIGFLTMKDILKIEPQLFEQMVEALHIKEESDKLRRLDRIRKHRSSAGIEPRENVEGPCEGCGNFGLLEEEDGRMLCSSCRHG